MPMTIDYGKTYSLDKFVYTPRQDNGGNGNVSKMKVESPRRRKLDRLGVQTWDKQGQRPRMRPRAG